MEGFLLRNIANAELNTDETCLTNPAIRSVELFAEDIRLFGEVQPETVQMVLDEELTNAAEDIVSQKAKYGMVPRTYYVQGRDLVDKYGNSLTSILDYGIEWCEEEIKAGKPGSKWELLRRKADRANLPKIVGLEDGQTAIEISAPPKGKPQEELEAQGYNGMTFIRASAKDEEVRQYNFMVPSSEPEFLLKLQLLLGVERAGQITDPQKLLETPIVKVVDVSELENFIGLALLESSPGQAVVNMVHKSINARRDAWQFVSSGEHADLWQDLECEMRKLATVDRAWWGHGMGKIRQGFLKSLRERYEGKMVAVNAGGIIQSAAARAVQEGDVFITCGGKIDGANTSPNAQAMSRSTIAEKLREEVKGKGKCSACGAQGLLYGCGVFCGACNRLWCDEYKKGKDLSIDQVRYRRYKNPGPENKLLERPGILDELAQYWYELTQQVKREQLARKQRAERSAKY